MYTHPRFRFVVTLFCSFVIMLQFWVFWGARGRAFSGWPDFSIFYAAGLTIRRGQGAVLYNDAVQRQVQQEFMPQTLAVRSPLPYNHPPFEVLLYLPLTYVSYVHAYFIWFVINVALLAGCAYILRPWLSALTNAFPWFMFAMPLAFFPVADSLLQGQDSIVLLMVYCLAYVAFLRKEEVWAGVFLGLGLFKFHLVLPFVFLLLVKRRWRSLAGILISASVETAVSLMMVGWKELLHYPFYVWQFNRKQPPGIIVPDIMPNLRGLIMGWGSSSAALQIVLFVLSLLLLIWASRRFAPENLEKPDAWNAGFSVALLTTFLVGYHSYAHDMSITLLPCLITLDRLLQQPPPRRANVLLVVVGVLFSPLFLYMTLFVAHQKVFALVLLLFAWAVAPSIEPSVPPGITTNEKRAFSFVGSCL